jgi:undecaprenyl pyrophosphate phosphatase UppP
MFGHRNAHYFLWFLFFGLIAGIAEYLPKHQISSEAVWLLVSGLLGILVTQKWLNEGKFAKPYDFIIGVIFTLVGLIGVLDAFGLHLLSNLSSLPSVVYDKGAHTLIGLSLSLLPALIHMVLGLQSLNHGMHSGK